MQFGKIKKVKLQSLRKQYELLSFNDQETISDDFRLQFWLNSMRAWEYK